MKYLLWNKVSGSILWNFELPIIDKLLIYKINQQLNDHGNKLDGFAFCSKPDQFYDANPNTKILTLHCLSM